APTAPPTTRRVAKAQSHAPAIVIGTESMDYVLNWRPGDCLTWPQYGGATDSLTHEVVVPCSKSHLVELAGSIHIDRNSDAYPTHSEWDVIARNQCTLFVDGLLGGPLAADSRYYATELHPTSGYWVAKHRHWVQCAIAAKRAASSSTGSELSPFIGPVEG